MPWLFYWLFRLHWTFHSFCSSLYLFSIRSAFLSSFHSIVFLSSQYYGTQASGPETGILLPRKLKKRSLERRKKKYRNEYKEEKRQQPKKAETSQKKKKWANGAGLWTMNLKRRPQTISERKKIIWGGNMKTITKARVPFQNRTQSNVYEKEREREKETKKKVRLLQTQSNG